MTDEKGLINALGQDNMSKIQKDASIAKAEAERDVKVAQAEAAKIANDARVLADTEIFIKQNALTSSLGIDLKTLLAGFLGGKLASGSDASKAIAQAAQEVRSAEPEQPSTV